MRSGARILGLLGLVLLFFGALSFLGYGVLESYAVIHLVLGGAMVLGWLIASLGELGELARARRTRKGANLFVSSLLGVAVLVMLNLLALRSPERVDLTEEQIFSLSPQARKILDSGEGAIRMTAYLEGGQNPQVETLLESFANGSGRIEAEIVDPDLAPERIEEDGITNYGTIRVASGAQATNVIEPSEETLTNAIIRVTRAGRPRLCFVTGDGEPALNDNSTADGYFEAATALRNENFEVEPLALLQEGAVPPECRVLVLAGPQRPLSDASLQAISEWLEGGGSALFLLPPRSGDEVAPLLANWGIQIGDDIVVDQVIRLFEGPTLGLNPIVENYGAHPITLQMRERTVFPLTRSIRPGPATEGLTTSTLASTSASSWAETDLEAVFGESLAEQAVENGDKAGPVSVAAAVHADLATLGRGEGTTRLVAFGSAGFADNRNLGQLWNRDLFLNAIAWLAAEEDLVSIRSRNLRVSRVRFNEDEATTIFYLSVLVLPELVLLLGLAAWWRRSRL